MKTVLTCMVAAALTVTVNAAASADTTTYLEIVRMQPSIHGSDAYLIRVGNTICGLKDDGVTDLTIAQALVENNQVDDYYDGGYLVGAAEHNLCPEHAA